jgi:hypothetical protein
LEYQDKYKILRAALRNYFFSWNQGRSDPLAEFSGLRALFEERKERQAEDAKLDVEDNDPEQKMMAKGDEKVEDHKQKMMAEEDKKVEEALAYLLDKAIERFGYTARAVYNAIFDFDSATRESQHAFKITFQQLTDTVKSLASDGTVNSASNRIVAICPVYSASQPYERVAWKVAFNSDWVATEVTKNLKDAENIEVRRVIRQFQGIPQAASMVGSLFEPFVHTLIPEGGSWRLIRMISNETKESSPKFAVPPQLSPDYELKLEEVSMRKTTNFKNVSDLSALDAEIYYLPDAANFALFDSFMVDIDYPKRSATLWIFQVTKSQLHRGSAKGYLHVRKLILILKNQLTEEEPPFKTTKVTSKQSPSEPVVNVCYVIVVLKVEGGLENWAWQLPAGWDERCTYNDHRGNVYCLEISPAAVP